MLYTLEQAKQKLGIKHTSYLRKMIAEKRLSAKKYGNVWIVDDESIEKYIKNK